MIYKDYSSYEPAVKEFNIGINQSYQDVNDLKSVVKILVVRSLAKTTLSGLVNLDISDLTGVMTGTLKGATGSTMKVLDITTDTLKGTTNCIKNILKKPFDSK